MKKSILMLSSFLILSFSYMNCARGPSENSSAPQAMENEENENEVVPTDIYGTFAATFSNRAIWLKIEPEGSFTFRHYEFPTTQSIVSGTVEQKWSGEFLFSEINGYVVKVVGARYRFYQTAGLCNELFLNKDSETEVSYGKNSFLKLTSSEYEDSSNIYRRDTINMFHISDEQLQFYHPNGWPEYFSFTDKLNDALQISSKEDCSKFQPVFDLMYWKKAK